jgi:hypothetical protein
MRRNRLRTLCRTLCGFWPAIGRAMAFWEVFRVAHPIRKLFNAQRNVGFR